MTNMTATEDDTRPLLEKARAAMSGLAETEAALSSVGERLREARASGQREDDVPERALTAVLAGQPVPDVGDQLGAIRQHNETARATVEALTSLQALLHARWRDTHTQQADRALSVLRTELSALLTQVRPVLTQLGGVTDAEAAISVGRTDEWQEACNLAGRYAEIRAAQVTLVSAALHPADQPQASIRVAPESRRLVADYGHVRNADLHYPELGTGDANRRADQLSETRIIEGRVVFSSHVDRPVTVRPWVSGDVLEDLRFILRDGVQAWLPTVAELTGARDEHEQRVQADARAEAERRPGDDDPQPFLRAGRKMPPPPAALLDRLAREELGDPA